MQRPRSSKANNALRQRRGDVIPETHDMLGINNEFSPRFLRRYANLYSVMTDGVSRYVSDVKSGDFPNEKEQY